jgi:hypothetical protein
MRNYIFENVLSKIKIIGNKMPLHIIKTIVSYLFEQYHCDICVIIIYEFEYSNFYKNNYLDSYKTILNEKLVDDESNYLSEDMIIDRTNYWN